MNKFRIKFDRNDGNSAPGKWHLGLLCFTLAAGFATKLAAATEFSFQGYLEQNGVAVNGSYDFLIELYDDPQAGSPLSAPNNLPSVTVRDGIFEVTLDFGPVALVDPNRWLEIQVKASAQPAFSTLVPRQRIAPTPHAYWAANAGPDAVDSTSVANGVVSSDSIGASQIGSAQIAQDAISSGQIPFNTITQSKIQSGAVGAGTLASNSVSTGEIQANAVLSGEIQAGAVGASEITSASVTSEHLRTGSVAASEFATGAVQSANILDQAVVASKIQPNSVQGTHVNPAQVQRRVSSSCPAGQSIRAIASNGSVTCQSDRQGVVGFNSPATYPISSVNGQLFQSINMAPVNTHICIFSEIDLREMDSGANGERPSCQITVSGGLYVLMAFSDSGRDNDAYCEGLCFAITSVP